LTLPDNDRIRILALTAADEPWVVTPAHPLYDTLERNEEPSAERQNHPR
jgi:hypothetical protein